MDTNSTASRHDDHDHHISETPASRLAFSATVHCFTGCAIGEVLGLVLSTAFGWNAVASVAVAVVLAFVFGYSFTLIPLLRGGMAPHRALRLALVADTVSIIVMELVDNAIMLIIPGAMVAGLTDMLFWASLVISLVVAFIAAYPVNWWLISRGRGHAVVHQGHGSH
jgi:hypothetical protein